MKKLLLIFLFFLPLILKAEVNQNHDFQLWLSQRWRFPIIGEYDGEIAIEERIGNDAKELFFYYVQGQFFIPLNKYFVLGPAYRQSFTNLNEDHLWRPIYHPFIDLFFEITKKGFKLQERSRINYLMPEFAPSAWEWREFVQIETPWHIGKAIIYVSNEFFVRERMGLNQNRLISGLLLPFNQRVQANLYYLLRFQLHEDGWRHHNILGIIARFIF